MTRRGGGGGGYYVVIIQEVMGIHADLETDLANKDFNKIINKNEKKIFKPKKPTE